MGFLASADVEECSATDLIGQYIGHTGPKTIAKLQKALGRVLFIDEAYRLGEGHFAGEAINELVDSLTKPQFMNKMIVILAGYEKDMSHLMSVNEGLSSRFPEEVVFTNLEPEDCFAILQKSLAKVSTSMHGVDPGMSDLTKVLQLFVQLSKLMSWGNDRDVKTVAKSITQAVFRSANESTNALEADSALIIDILDKLITTRREREVNVKASHPSSLMPVRAADQNAPRSAPNITTASATKSDASGEQEQLEEESEQEQGQEQEQAKDKPEMRIRDAGVSDATWQQLQLDKAAQEHAELAREAELAVRQSALHTATQKENNAAE